MRELSEEELQQVNGGDTNASMLICLDLVSFSDSRRCKKFESIDTCKCLEYAE